MGDVGGDLAQVAHECLDSVEHGIDAQRQPIEFIPDLGDRDTLSQIALNDVAGCGADGFNLAHQPAAHDGATGQGECNSGGGSPDEGFGYEFFHFVELVCAPTYEQVVIPDGYSP